MLQIFRLMFAGGLTQTTETFTANKSWVAPAGVTTIDTASGYGAKGVDAQYNQPFYNTTYRTTYVRRDGGANDVTTSTSDVTYGTSPQAAGTYYCGASYSTPDSTIYSSGQDCYRYNQFGGDTTPAQRGTATTGFSKTFQGSLGNVAQTTTTFTAIAVTPGSTYSLVVPSGGTLSITYRK